MFWGGFLKLGFFNSNQVEISYTRILKFSTLFWLETHNPLYNIPSYTPNLISSKTKIEIGIKGESLLLLYHYPKKSSKSSPKTIQKNQIIISYFLSLIGIPYTQLLATKKTKIFEKRTIHRILKKPLRVCVSLSVYIYMYANIKK